VDKALRVLGVIALIKAIIFMIVTMFVMVFLGVGLVNALNETPAPPPSYEVPYYQ